MAQVFQYPHDFFVWVDETGSDNCDQIRNFGYALRGLTPVHYRFLVRGTRISTIAGMSCEGLLTHEMVTGTTNGDKFMISSVVVSFHVCNYSQDLAPYSLWTTVQSTTLRR